LRRAVQRDAADAASGTGTPRREGEHVAGEPEPLQEGDHVRQGSELDEGHDASDVQRPASPDGSPPSTGDGEGGAPG
jgi:hypothetical protein